MKKFRILLCLFTIIGLSSSQSQEANLPEDILDELDAAPKLLKLISPDTPTPIIVIGNSATEAERYAAEELAWHLQEITGKHIPIQTDEKTPAHSPIIAVGESTLTKSYNIQELDIEQYIIDVKPDLLVIVGGKKPPMENLDGPATYQDRGTLYGVYEFLEKQGVRWYRPEPWGWHIPKRETIALKLGKNISSKPDFIGRCAVRAEPRWDKKSDEYSALTAKWLARQRVNVRASKEAKYGGTAEIGMDHAHSRLISPAKYLKKHPEFFALVAGERGNPGSGKLPQLCLGNPKLQDAFAQEVIQRAKSNPGLLSISVDPEDGTHPDRRMCTCELCVAMDDPADPTNMSNRIFAFTNIVAKKLAQEAPGAKVGLYAYSMHTRPPTKVQHIEPNVIIGFANINSWTDWSKKLTDSASKENQQFVDLLKDWKKLLQSQPWMREYSAYGWMGPIPMYRLLQERIQTFRDLGVAGFVWPGEPNWGPQLPLLYFKAQLQWNPDLDLNSELDLFYTNYYGPAAKPMQAYHEKLMSALENSSIGNSEQKGISSGGRGLHLLYNPELLKELGAFISQAQQAVQGNSIYERRLRGTVAGYEFCKKISDILQTKAEKGTLKPNPRYAATTYLESEEAEKMWNEFKTWLLESNKEDLTFEVVTKDGNASAVALNYMEGDILRNGRYSLTDERRLLIDQGFTSVAKELK